MPVEGLARAFEKEPDKLDIPDQMQAKREKLETYLKAKAELIANQGDFIETPSHIRKAIQKIDEGIAELEKDLKIEN